MFVIHDVSVSRFSIKFNLQSNSRHVSDRVTSVQDFGKMYQSSNFLIWPLLRSVAALAACCDINNLFLMNASTYRAAAWAGHVDRDTLNA